MNAVTETPAAGGLQEALQRLRLHISNTPLALVEWGPEYRVREYSARAEQVFGWSAAEVIGKRIDEIPWVPEDDWPAVRAVMADMSTGARPTNVNANRNLRKDGSVIYCEWYNSALLGADGRLSSVLSLVLDVTERERALQEARESGERFRTLADHIAQLAWMADERGAIVWYNRRWLEYTGLPLEDMLGWGWQQVHHPDHVARVREKFRRHVEAGEPWEDTFPLRGADGRYRWFLSRALPIRDAGGKVLRWFGTNTDVTVQRDAEEALRASDRRKTEFLAVLSHELRNPLASIRNSLHVLGRAPAGSPASAHARDVVQRQVDHLAKLVDDLLDVSRIDHGKITLERTVFDAREVVRRAADDARPAFAARGVELAVALDPAPLWIDADATRVAQIAGNLLSNAVKFTPPGGHVALVLQRAGGACALRVRDDGVGIEPELVEQIFEPFAQAERTRGSAGGGVGIGLALVRSLARLHGGDASATSAGSGRGAEIEVTLPLTAGAPAPAPATPAARSEPPRRGLAVLVVEDNVDAGESLVDLLRLHGHDARLASDGAAGLAAFGAAPADVVVCDIGLPDMSGHEVVRRLRALPGGRDALAVALSGYAQAADVARATEAGFDAHLPKPPPLDKLDDLLATAAERRRERGG